MKLIDIDKKKQQDVFNSVSRKTELSPVRFIGLRGFNYDELYPPAIKIVPQGDTSEMWREDYRTMREQMVYGEAPNYDELMAFLSSLNERVSKLPYRP